MTTPAEKLAASDEVQAARDHIEYELELGDGDVMGAVDALIAACRRERNAQVPALALSVEQLGAFAEEQGCQHQEAYEKRAIGEWHGEPCALVICREHCDRCLALATIPLVEEEK